MLSLLSRTLLATNDTNVINKSINRSNIAHFHNIEIYVTRYIFKLSPGIVYVVYVCMCVGNECVSSILYMVIGSWNFFDSRK